MCAFPILITPALSALLPLQQTPPPPSSPSTVGTLLSLQRLMALELGLVVIRGLVWTYFHTSPLVTTTQRSASSHSKMPRRPATMSGLEAERCVVVTSG